MTDIFSRITSEIGRISENPDQLHQFYYFEPWDVERRPDWVVQQALDDGVDLYADNFIVHVGIDPHPFQTGFLQNKDFFRGMIAATSIGKSIAALVDAIIMTTGEVPICMRVDKGVDTGVPRMVSVENIIRWGRYVNGVVVDHDVKVRQDGTWNCGTIIGAGRYPVEKMCPVGGKIWIGTYMRAMHEYWWPRFTEQYKRMIPDGLIDSTRGVGGFDIKNRVIYTSRSCQIAIITYESGYNRFEAERVHAVILDEEPEDPRIVQAAQQHAMHGIALIETPYRGITYTRDLLFPKVKNPDKTIFHACQYDSPYQSRDRIQTLRANMPLYEIGSRIWGLHSEARGKPFYDRNKINMWMHKFRGEYKLKSVVPQQEYYSVLPHVLSPESPCLMSINMRMDDAKTENIRDVWRIYEEPKAGVAYMLSSDPAEGAETIDEAGDNSCAMIARLDDYAEDGIRVVATLVSTCQVMSFARICSHAARIYNNALMCAETRRGATNAAFAIELRDWPYWYKMTTIRDATNKPRMQNGFDTNAATRSALFELIGSWLNTQDAEVAPECLDDQLLKELAGCIVGKNGRPDHPKGGTLDMVICFGILLYITKNSREQIVLNEDYVDAKKPFEKIQRWLDMGKPEDKSKSQSSKFLAEDVPHWR